MNVICKKKFRKLKVGDSVEFIARGNKVEQSEINGNLPIGAYYEKYFFVFIYYSEFKEHFCTLKEFRKIKVDRLNEI